MPYSAAFEPDQGLVKVAANRGMPFGDPALAQWVIDNADRYQELGTVDQRLWLLGVGMYRLVEFEPMLFGLVDQHLAELAKPLDADAKPPEPQRQLFQSLAAIAQPKSRDRLRKLMEAELTHQQADPRGSKREKAKAMIAAALVNMNDKDAAKFLYEGVEAYGTNDQANPKREYYCFHILAYSLYERRLNFAVDRLHRRLTGVKQDDIEKIQQQMAVSQLNPRSIQALVYDRNPDPRHHYSRLLAIDALAELGTVKDIERLGQVGADDKNPRSHLKRYRDRAQMIMRCRLWRELARE